LGAASYMEMPRLDVQDKARSATAKGGDGSLKSEISDHINETNSEFGGSTTAKAGSGSKETADKGNNEGSSRSKAKDSARKDDESRTESSASSAANKSGKSTLGKQIGEKMRSFLGGGKKSERSTKSSSGILNACPGTVQGEEGWYEHGESERYYFILVDGKWSLLYGPMTEDDFESFSAKVIWALRLTGVFWWRWTDERAAIAAGDGAGPHGGAATHVPAQVWVLSEPRAARAARVGVARPRSRTDQSISASVAMPSCSDHTRVECKRVQRVFSRSYKDLAMHAQSRLLARLGRVLQTQREREVLVRLDA